MAPRVSIVCQFQTLLFQLVSLELLCKPHQTLPGPAPPHTLFARGEFPTWQDEQFRKRSKLIWRQKTKHKVNMVRYSTMLLGESFTVVI